MAKWQGYSLNLCNVTYFKKEENEFVETTLEAFTLYLDRYKQKDGVSKCIDIVTGRVFFLKEDTTVIYSQNGESKTINAKAGDIVVSLYEEKFPKV